MDKATKTKITSKWYGVVGIALLIILGLAFCAPLLIGGFIIYLISKKVSNAKVKYALITLIALPTLLTGYAWASAVVNPPEDNLAQKTSKETMLGANKSESSSAEDGQIAGTEVKKETDESTDLVQVTKVIDGDTIEIEGGQKIRYIGINTPETVHPNKPVECFGKEASAKNKELVAGKKIRVEKDISETDKYGRLLRYVWVGNTFVNDYLVRQGYAKASSYPPDVKYQDQFQQAEYEARNLRRGLWAANACSTLAATAAEDKDCSDFNTQQEAQEFYIAQGGPAQDPHRLDGDNDGIACESLPSSTSKQTPAPQEEADTKPETVSTAEQDTSTGYSCACSKTCAEMASCEEAYYQLNECGCSRRDGDNDGVPCEDICPGGEATPTVQETEPEPEPEPEPETEPEPESAYTCDCSKTCGEMSSCEEAYYQLEECGCSRRDGDDDGVPCENICPGG